MTNSDILYHRLINQQIATTVFTQPGEVVSWMCAMQAQEYGSAKWAVGLRLPGTAEAQVEQALNEGTILRTHLMRPTWHFVAPADICWLLKLTAPRVHAVNAFVYRSENLDTKIFKRSSDIIAKSLEGGRHKTRTELAEILDRAKIHASGVRLACIIMYAELEGIICSGPRLGKQFTYALLDERVTVKEKKFVKEEALAELALRYFTSRWPATLKDFVWWSGLSMKDAKDGIGLLPGSFIKEMSDKQEYITAATTGKRKDLQATFLMPAFDEYALSYKDRGAIDGTKETHSIITKNGGSVPTLIVDGRIAGTWKATKQKNNTTVETTAYIPLSKTKQHAVKHAVQHYCSFMG